MNLTHFLFVSALALSLTACGDDAPPAEEAEASSPAATTTAAPTPAPATSSGGYVPNDSERVPGITMTQEELDKLDAEARANTPAPVIPAE